MHADDLPVSSGPVAPAEKNPATDALEAAKAWEAADHKEAAEYEAAATGIEPKA